MISLIISFEIFHVVVSDPNILFWIAAFVTVTTINPNSTKIFLAIVANANK